MSYLDLSDRRVEFTAVLDPRERRKSIVGRRVAAAKEKKRGRKEKKQRRKGREREEKWGNSRVCDRFHYEIVMGVS